MKKTIIIKGKEYSIPMNTAIFNDQIEEKFGINIDDIKDSLEKDSYKFIFGMSSYIFIFHKEFYNEKTNKVRTVYAAKNKMKYVIGIGGFNISILRQKINAIFDMKIRLVRVERTNEEIELI